MTSPTEPMPTSVDVVVAGAGPTGLTLAIMLQQAGLDILVVDRAPQAGSDARASLVHVRSIELLDALGVGSSLARQAEPITSAVYYDVGLPVCDLRFKSLGSDHDAALGISQVQMETALVERLERLGGTVHRPVTVASVESEAGAATVSLTRPESDPVSVSTRFVVGCDGANSSIRQQAALDGTGADIPESFVVANVELSGEIDRSALHLFAADDGFLVLSALPDGLWRYTATIDRDAAVPSAEQLQLMLSERGPRTASATIGHPRDVGRYRLRRAIAKRLRAGPILLAGDAAHTFSPAGGQGMNTGIADATNLGWKLALVVNGQANDSLLDTYDTERRRAARNAAERVDRFGEALTLHNPLARGLRDAVALLAGKVDVLSAPVLRGMAGFDTVYAKGAVMTGRPGGRGWGTVGERLDRPSPTSGTDGGYRLLVSHEDDVAGYQRVVDRYRAPITADLTDGAGTGAALVRPDGHLGWSGPRDGHASLEQHLDQWLTR